MPSYVGSRGEGSGSLREVNEIDDFQILSLSRSCKASHETHKAFFVRIVLGIPMRHI